MTSLQPFIISDEEDTVRTPPLDQPIEVHLGHALIPFALDKTMNWMLHGEPIEIIHPLATTEYRHITARVTHIKAFWDNPLAPLWLDVLTSPLPALEHVIIISCNGVNKASELIIIEHADRHGARLTDSGDWGIVVSYLTDSEEIWVDQGVRWTSTVTDALIAWLNIWPKPMFVDVNLSRRTPKEERGAAGGWLTNSMASHRRIEVKFQGRAFSKTTNETSAGDLPDGVAAPFLEWIEYISG